MSQSNKKEPQGKRWCFTFYDPDDLRILREQPLDALVVAREAGSENQREHYQGYCKFPSNKRFSWWKRLFHTDARKSAHWELAKGPEWKCRRYIADVASYLLEEPNAHPKTQGEVIADFGCEAYVDEQAPPSVRVIKMLVDGAALSQVFRTHPVFYFHNCRKITDLRDHIQGWRANGEDFKPERYDLDRPSKRIKASPPEEDSSE